MKLYAVCEMDYEATVGLWLCTSKERAEEIAANKEATGNYVEIIEREDGYADPTAFCFNLAGECEGTKEHGEDEILYENGQPNSIVALADTKEEAQRKALGMMILCYQKMLDDLD